MSDIKLSHAAERRSVPALLDGLRPMAPDTRLLLQMASQLGPRDRAALAHIIQRTNEICSAEGEEIALAVLEQIAAILSGRPADA